MPTIPTISGEAMREVDLRLTERIGVSRVMEVVSARTVECIRYHLKLGSDVPFCVVAGRGHNGGDAIAVGRMLQGWGYDVSLVLASSPDELRGETRAQLELYRSFNGAMVEALPTRECVIVDGLLGTGLERDPEGTIATMIDAMNDSGHRIVSLDLPSGLHATTGEPFPHCVRATWTLTYHVPKSGLLENRAKPYVGELFCCESGLTFTEFPEIEKRLREFYGDGVIVRIG